MAVVAELVANLRDQPGGGVDLAFPAVGDHRGLGIELGPAFGEVERERGVATLQALPFALGSGKGVVLAGVGGAQPLGLVVAAGDHLAGLGGTFVVPS